MYQNIIQISSELEIVEGCYTCRGPGKLAKTCLNLHLTYNNFARHLDTYVGKTLSGLSALLIIYYFHRIVSL